MSLVHEDDHILAYERGDVLFVFNFSPDHSQEGYLIPVSKGEDYHLVLSTDDMAYGGWGQVQHGDASAYVPGEKTPHVRVYIPARTAIVLVPKSKLKAAEKN